MNLRPRSKHYWRKALYQEIKPGFDAAQCNARKTIGMLSTMPQPRLNWFSRIVAIISTPFKRAGISGWKETGCVCDAVGKPVRDAQHSTDGFWTIDVALEALAIGGVAAQQGRFVRIEVEPGHPAHAICCSNSITDFTKLSFGGPVVIDTDGPFLEVHPEGELKILEG